MKAVIETIQSRVFFSVMALWLVVYSLLLLWPASHWFEVRSVSISASVEGQKIPLLVDRSIHRNFVATWYVDVRQWTEKGWVYYCGGSGTNQYTETATLPPDLDLSWWTGGKCDTLPAGRYVVDTYWLIHPSGLVPEKEVKVASNIFEVRRPVEDLLPQRIFRGPYSPPSSRFL